MTTNNFEPEISNANFNSAQYYIDDDGSFKFTSPILASSNFDGSIPIFEGEIDAEDLNTGMLIKLDDDQYYGILSIFKDDPDLEDDPSTEITIEYLDSDNNAQRLTYDFSDIVEVRYEDWDEKYLGSQGWALTYGGNAIFANVGVRGRIEATEGDIEGNLIVTGGLYTSEDAETSGGIVLNNSGFTSYNTSGSTTFNIDAETGTVTIGGYATIEDVISSSAYFETIIDDLNDRISASISDLTIDIDSLSASVDFLYDAGFVTDADLVTTGATIISGNNITTGVINTNLMNVTSDLTPNRGIKISALGLFGYDSGGNPTFSINSSTGAATFSGDVIGSVITGSTINTGPSNALVTIAQYFNGRQNQGYIQFTDDWYGGTYFIAPANPPSGPALQLSGNLRLSGNLVVPPGYTISGGGVVTTSNTYSNPTWITSLAGSKITGNISGNSGGLSGGPSITVNGITNQSNGITNNGGQIISLPTYNNASSLTNNMHITSSGVLRRNSSTQRIKEKITPLSGDLSQSVLQEKVLNEPPKINFRNILNISPVEYTPIEDSATGRRVLGFIAEDIADKVPEIATYDDEGIPEYYDVNGIVAGLLSIIKDQQELLDDLQNRVLQLETQLGG